jgi:peptide/nickel transport system substrate-binding protein
LSYGESLVPPKTGGILRFGIQKDIINVNPFQRTLSVNKDVGSIAFECLLTADRNGEVRPSLATSWETSQDGLQYTFRLRHGVKFHNGKEMLAEDVVWSMQYTMDPKNAAYGRDGLRSVASVKAVDPSTVQVTLKEPYVPFLSRVTNIQAFPLVPGGSVPSGREKMQIYPPGTGPFVMTDYKPNQVLAFRRFEHYWQKGLPYVDAVNFRPVEDDTVRLMALRAGDFDIVEKISYDQAARIQKGEIKELGLEFAHAAGYRAVVFNTEKPPFNNMKLRQAIAYALEKPSILTAITWDMGTVTDQKMLRGTRWHVPLTDRRRDLARARALLREAGHPNGFKLKVQVAQWGQRWWELIQAQLKEADIQLDAEIVDFAKSQNDLRDGNFTVTMHGGLPDIDPDLAYYQYFHTETGPVRVSNYSRYSNARVDKLLDAGRAELDFRTRYRIYKEIVEILHEEVPQISLAFAPYVFAMRNHVRGFRVHASGFFYDGLEGLAAQPDRHPRPCGLFLRSLALALRVRRRAAGGGRLAGRGGADGGQLLHGDRSWRGSHTGAEQDRPAVRRPRPRRPGNRGHRRHRRH